VKVVASSILFIHRDAMGSGVSTHRRKDGGVSVQEKVKYLKESPFFQYLTPETINDFAQCFPETLRTNPGKRITLDSRKMYIVCNGEVDLSTSYPDKGAKIEAKGYLCRKRRGDTVSVCKAKAEVQRRMTVKSNKMKELAEDIMTVAGGDTDTLLLCGDPGMLENFCTAHPELSKTIYEICTSHIEDRLQSIPFLQNVSKSKLAVLAAMCRYEAFDSDKTVFEEDSSADKLYVILSGVVQVIAKSPLALSLQSCPSVPSRALSEQAVTLLRSLECSTGRKTILEGFDEPHAMIAELTGGDYFGETALVFNIARTCGVRTTEKCLFLTVHKTDFENFLKICPIEESLEKVIKRRMVSKFSTLGIPFLNGIPDELLSALAATVTISEVPKDHVIFNQGDLGDRFYIIVHGSVKVENMIKSPTKVEIDAHTDIISGSNENDSAESITTIAESIVGNSLGSLGPGQYFGEMSLVDTECHLRKATVTATQKCILLSIDNESFQTFIGSNTVIHAEFQLRLLKDSATLKNVLEHPLGIASFRDFLDAEHASENIEFWVAVKNFKDGASSVQRKQKGKNIYEKFCTASSKKQINIAHKTLAEIDAALLKDEDISSELFDVAFHEIIRVLELDKFPRYKKSPYFKKFLSTLGVL
jgi:CRP-like cAMP-binding protein